jgi:hypothetical protein
VSHGPSGGTKIFDYQDTREEGTLTHLLRGSPI